MEATAAAQPAPPMQYCYSTNEEEYHGSFDTANEALAQAALDLAGDYDSGEAADVWVAKIVPARKTLEGLSLDRQVDYLVENIDEMLGEEIPSDDYILELTPEKRGQLEGVIKAWLAEHGSFSRYSVANPVKHTIVVGEN